MQYIYNSIQEEFEEAKRSTEAVNISVSDQYNYVFDVTTIASHA
jgi:hypothetical protein